MIYNTSNSTESGMTSGQAWDYAVKHGLVTRAYNSTMPNGEPIWYAVPGPIDQNTTAVDIPVPSFWPYRNR